MIWNVLFLDFPGYPQQLWARIWTRKGFRHVMAFAYDADNKQWLFVEPQPGQVIVRIAEAVDVERFIHFAKRNGKALSWTEQHCVTHGYSLRTCVSMMKDVIRFRGFCFTPHGLYRAMLKAGAEPTFEGEV